MRRWLTLAGIGLFGVGVWQNYRHLIAKVLRLPPVRNDVTVERGIKVPMPDGVSLATDLFLPRVNEPVPAILIRTPYGRPTITGFFGDLIAQCFAERGYAVVYQDVRGRFDSEGEWEPYIHEAGDGAATVAWIVEQAWSDGQVGMWGQSYVGYTLWATAVSGLPFVKAIVPVITQSFLADRGREGHQLDRTLRWLLLLDALVNPDLSRQERMGRAINAKIQDRAIGRGFTHLPIETVDEVILGKEVGFFRKWLEYPDQEHDYWQAVNFSPRVAGVTAPVHLVGGWYDIFLEGQLQDYYALRTAGRTPYLTIGGWTHLNTDGQWASIRAALAWFNTHLKGEAEHLRRKPVRLYVMGANEWRDFDSFPPPSTPETLYLRQQASLEHGKPLGDEPPDLYRYDPADPTPGIGGALLSSEAGAKDNRPLEARGDVLTYTTAPLQTAKEIIGQTQVRLWVESDVAHTDFFVRLTDVHPDGKSINICDGHLRLSGFPPHQPTPIEIDLAPTAHRFAKGHRIRLQLSSGAHPRIARNLGTGEPEMRGTKMVTANQVIYHDAERVSEVVLPVYQG
jgi:putative CocE/NonD family hydrolase